MEEPASEPTRPLRFRLNRFGSEEVFYRAQQPVSSGTNPPILPDIGFVAGNEGLAQAFDLTEDKKNRDIVMQHSIWNRNQPLSPFVSTSVDEGWISNRIANCMAVYVEKHRKTLPPSTAKLDPIRIAEIRPGRVPTETMKYYKWNELIGDLKLDWEVSPEAQNNHEYVFLVSIPAAAIVFYGTVKGKYSVDIGIAELTRIM